MTEFFLKNSRKFYVILNNEDLMLNIGKEQRENLRSKKGNNHKF